MFTNLAARLVLRVTGWRVVGEGELPDRCVVLAAPHTSNWDLLYMLAMARVLGIRPAWMGKSELFEGLQGRVLRALGGIPIDRSSPQETVGQLTREFATRERLALTIPPEGTRSHRDHWRSGFYHIARGADVPVVLAFLDYGRKRGGLGPTLQLTGDIPGDMAIIRAFYADKRGRFPAKEGDVRLRAELA